MNLNRSKNLNSFRASKMLSVFAYKELPKTFLIFYTVGFLLYVIPYTRTLFLFLTPFSLLLVFGAVIYHHKNKNFKFYIYSWFVILFSFFIEAAGVKTGVIFGEYKYLTTLGTKVLETPLIIGVNWLMLAYCSAAIMEYIQKKSGNKISFVLKAIGGASLMLCYDFVAELVAPIMKMWEFRNAMPPVDNYIMWFILAFLFHILLLLFKIQIKSKPAVVLFTVQLIFFFFIYLYNQILL